MRHNRLDAQAIVTVDFMLRGCYKTGSSRLVRLPVLEGRQTQMLVNCEVVGCKARVPQQLEEQRRCLLHFTLELEQTCMTMRRETAVGGTRRERYDEMRRYMAEHGQKLAQLATSGTGLTDETKARILSTFLTLMNCRENIERIAARQENERRIG